MVLQWTIGRGQSRQTATQVESIGLQKESGEGKYLEREGEGKYLEREGEGKYLEREGEDKYLERVGRVNT